MIQSALRVAIDPVDPTAPAVLPVPWQELESEGFHPDLVLRARGFFLAAKRAGFEEQAIELLRLFGEGFRRQFDPTPFLPKEDDPHRELKTNFLTALTHLSGEFGDRVSSVVWEAFAYLGCRDNPTEAASILSQAHRLPMPYWLADAAYHAAGKVYAFKHELDSQVFAKTGAVLGHNCDCSCDCYPMEEGEGEIRVPLRRNLLTEVTYALFSHLLSEGLLITGLGFPFQMGVSPEAAEAMALGTA